MAQNWYYVWLLVYQLGIYIGTLGGSQAVLYMHTRPLIQSFFFIGGAPKMITHCERIFQLIHLCSDRAA